MSDARKKSPKAPSLSLGEAIAKVGAIYNSEKRHAVATEIVAKDLGYKNAANGAAVRTLAAIKGYGLLISPKPGLLAVAKEVEDYLFCPDEKMKREIVRQWLVTPKIYRNLLDKFPRNLPSEAALKYELIQIGFTPSGADECVKNFLDSINFANYYDENGTENPQDLHDELDDSQPDLQDNKKGSGPVGRQSSHYQTQISPVVAKSEIDRIPIRLGGGRRAWLEIPVPFYEADKIILKAHIDLIVTDNEADKDEKSVGPQSS